MLDTIDGHMALIQPSLRVGESCYFESDMKPSDARERFEFAAYLIKGEEVFKIVIAELSVRQMKEFMRDPSFKRHLHQRMDKLAVKAGYAQSIINNDKFDKDI